MVAVIIGRGGLFDAICPHVPQSRWEVPAGDNPNMQIQYLIDHPAPNGRGVVFTNLAGNWVRVSSAGWRVMWCDNSPLPVGASPLSEQMLTRSINELSKKFWGVELPDRRLIGDVIMGRTRTLGTLLTITSMSGGVGKTVSSRRLCERAAEQGVSTLLIDGNMLQASQRSFFDPTRKLPIRTIANWERGMPVQKGATHGKNLHVNYDLVFAPPAGMSVTWDLYRRFIAEARKRWSFIVLDLDRISSVDLEDDSTAAGALIMPSLMSGDPCLFIVKAGRQTQGDAVSTLSLLPSLGVPHECVGIKDTIPVGMTDYQRMDYRQYGVWLGAEHQSMEASSHITQGESNWPDPLLDEVRERVLKWALPERGFDPQRFKPKEKKKGWFHR